MKKKIVICIFMLVISIGIAMAGKGLLNSPNLKDESAKNNSIQLSEKQDKGAEENTSQQKSESNVMKEESSASTENNKSNSNTSNNKESNNASSQTTAINQGKSNNTAAKSTVVAKSTAVAKTSSSTNSENKIQPTQKINLIITDTVSGKIILSKAINYDGQSAAEATMAALDSAKISYKVSGIGEALYFSSINGLRERAAGASSGWCYYVNGKKINSSSGSYKLNKDDTLEWKYLKDGLSD